VIVKGGSIPVPVDAVLPDLSGDCSVTVSKKPKATTACGTIITGVTDDSLSYHSPGTYTINWKYNYGNGNFVSQQQHVVVRDAIAPVPVRAVLPEITGECSVHIASAPMAIDNCAGMITATTTDPRDYSVPGNYTITWKYNDGHGNIVSQQQHVIVKSLALTVQAFPNPTNNQFSITVRSCNISDKVTIRIFDVLGRLVEMPKNVTLNEKIHFGGNYAAAPYILQVIQGKEIVTVKLLKLHGANIAKSPVL
jgi:hypothetical protein